MSTDIVPPNRAALWSRLALTTVQLAALCGVTPRQIQHWTLRGYLLASNEGRYNGMAIERVMLIKQGLDQGLSLHRAVRLANAFLAAQEPGVAAIAPGGLEDIATHLRAAGEDLGAILEVIGALVPAGDVSAGRGKDDGCGATDVPGATPER